jgi:hypothetical protein
VLPEFPFNPFRLWAFWEEMAEITPWAFPKTYPKEAESRATTAWESSLSPQPRIMAAAQTITTTANFVQLEISIFPPPLYPLI